MNSCLFLIPEKLHPLASSALTEWLCGNLSLLELARYAVLTNSDNLIWVECLLQLP